MCLARQGREVPRLHKEETLLARRFLPNVLAGHGHYSTSACQHMHAASREVMDLITALPADVIALSTTMTKGTDNLEMHTYTDKMD